VIGKVSKFAARISLAVWHAGALNPLGSAGELGCGVLRKRAQIEQSAVPEPVGKDPLTQARAACGRSASSA
jgi:hypothetical protein